MCGRYATFGPVSVSRQAREALEELELDIISEINQREDQFNIAPTQKALVVASGEKGYKAEMLRWGLIPSWAKDAKIGAKTINARAETVAEKPSFRTAFKKRRCLVPASGYFEWKGEAGSKQPYFIHDPVGHLLMFAGLWEAWRPSEAEEWLRTFAIITGEPGKVSGDIHDRQPVILPPDLWEVWMTGAPDEASATLAAAPEVELVYHPVTKAVGSPKNKGAEMVEPIFVD
jgi:putative SOS response-associated peptidase YedK